MVRRGHIKGKLQGLFEGDAIIYPVKLLEE